MAGQAMTKIPDDDPRAVAWRAYQESEEYLNSFRWAEHEQHRKGCLWAAFLQGWTDGRNVTEPDHEAAPTEGQETGESRWWECANPRCQSWGCALHDEPKGEGQETGDEWDRMRRDLATEDNRATGVPIFIVQQRVRDYGYDPRYVDTVVWLDGPNEYAEATEDEAARLESGEMDSSDWTKTGYRDRWEFVQPFATEQGADRYIEENRHNLTDPRVYVISGNRNHEWKALRARLSTGRPDGWVPTLNGLPVWRYAARTRREVKRSMERHRLGHHTDHVPVFVGSQGRPDGWNGWVPPKTEDFEHLTESGQENALRPVVVGYALDLRSEWWGALNDVGCANCGHTAASHDPEDGDCDTWPPGHCGMFVLPLGSAPPIGPQEKEQDG